MMAASAGRLKFGALLLLLLHPTACGACDFTNLQPRVDTISLICSGLVTPTQQTAAVAALPTACSVACSDAFLSWWTECGPTLGFVDSSQKAPAA